VRGAVATVIACCALALWAVPARPESFRTAQYSALSAQYDLDIPQQPLDGALRTFAEQTGLQVARFDTSRDGEVTVGPVHGRYTVDEALSLLLRPSGFAYALVNSHTIAVSNSPAARGGEGGASGSESQAQSPSEQASSGSGSGRAGEPDSDDAHLAQRRKAKAGSVGDEIVITGSRIAMNGMSTPTPVTMLSDQDLQQLKPGPLIEALDQMPQFLNNSTPQNSYNFSTTSGQSFLNMRGLGINRTLVLLDGRRITASSRLGATDISTLPQSLLQRVDIVTGGASAVYGSDAVAGVVNFILNTRFTGLELSGSGGITGRSDNTNDGVSLTFGTPIGERLHVVGTTEFYRATRVETFAGRDWFQGWGLVTNPQWLASGTRPRLLTLPDVSSTRYTFGGLIDAPGSPLNRLMFLPNGTPTPFVPGTPAIIGAGCYCQSGGIGDNYWSDRTGDGSLYPDMDRSSSFLYVDYELADDLTAYVQALHGHSTTNYVEVGAVQFAQWEATIYPDNAFLPTSLRQEMLREGLPSFGLSRLASSADLGVSRNQTSNSLLSYTAGLKGTLAGWRVGAYFQEGHNQSDSSLLNYVRTDRLSLAMDAVVDPASGGVVCRSTLYDRSNGCVPVDLFGAGNASPQSKQYVLGDKYGFASVHQRFIEASASRDVYQGWGAGPVSLAVGTSFRTDSLHQNADPPDYSEFVPRNDPALGIQGIPAAFAGNPFVYQFSSYPSIAGQYSVGEYFGETLLPLLANRSFAQQLNLSLAGRLANYSGSGHVWAWKGGLDWQVVDSVRLRGTLSRDTRAANLAERFDSQGVGVVVRDPFFGNSNATLSQFSTGNPTVRPERADTLTAGIVFQPSILRGLSLSVDWYRIDNKDAIAQLGAQSILNDCFAGAQQFCSLITRDPSTHQVVFIENEYLNVSQEKVSGTDVELDYQHGIHLFGGGPEHVSGRLIGSYLAQNSVTNQSIGTIDYAGQVGDGFNLPRLQILAEFTYANGPYQALLQERFIGTGVLDVNYVQGVDIDRNTIPSIAYTDLDLKYTRPRQGGWPSIEIYGHITNLFDRDPPLAPNYTDFTGATPTNKTVYDVLGRRFSAGVTVRF
jgi:outer membrane receptor protein involved in Fe transport